MQGLRRRNIEVKWRFSYKIVKCFYQDILARAWKTLYLLNLGMSKTWLKYMSWTCAHWWCTETFAQGCNETEILQGMPVRKPKPCGANYRKISTLLKLYSFETWKWLWDFVCPFLLLNFLLDCYAYLSLILYCYP